MHIDWGLFCSGFMPLQETINAGLRAPLGRTRSPVPSAPSTPCEYVSFVRLFAYRHMQAMRIYFIELSSPYSHVGQGGDLCGALQPLGPNLAARRANR